MLEEEPGMGECRLGESGHWEYKFFMAVAILPSTAFYPCKLFCSKLFVIGQS